MSGLAAAETRICGYSVLAAEPGGEKGSPSRFGTLGGRPGETGRPFSVEGLAGAGGSGAPSRPHRLL